MSKIKWAWFSSLGKTKQDRLDIGARMAPSYDNPRCEECGLCKETYYPFVFPTLRGPTVFVTSVPNEDEEYKQELGHGRLGRLLLNYVIAPLGLREAQYSLMTAVLCRPRSGKVNKRQGEMCRPFVAHLLNKIKGEKRIVAMGVDASSVLLQRDVKLTDEIGEVSSTPFGEVTVTYSPAQVLVPDLEDGGIKLGFMQMIKTHVRRFVLKEPAKVFPEMRVLE